MTRVSLLLMFLPVMAAAAPHHGEQAAVELPTMTADRTAVTDTVAPEEHTIGGFREMVREFDRTDDDYIEPPHYNLAVELRAVRNFEDFILSSNGQSIMFSPDQHIKVGPYFGWRWVFLGTTFDLKNISLFGNSAKREIDFSIYSSQVGVDLFYRRTGSDYKLREVRMGYGIDGDQYEGIPFDGISVGITGVNAYYIFNHRHFSYPAAFSPGTCQKISCGSWLAGAGFTNNTLHLDFDKLCSVVEQRMGDGTEAKLDSAMMFDRVEYNDFSLSAGYAYTWVLLKNVIFCGSAQAAVAYKTSYGNTADEDDGFSFGKVNLDGIGRLALVYNDTRWYGGLHAIFHTNHYHTSRFSANNIFGSFSAFIGYNFWPRKKYKKK
jgi:hypothetical protein